MILKDQRLLTCAALVKGNFVCDVGTDHGYLPAYLITSGKCSRAIACDINPLPLSAAKATAEREGIYHKVSLILSDGLKSVPTENVTDIVIAGMGGELIYRIISEDNRLRENNINLILQPMTRAEYLRRALAEGGFETDSEVICRQGKFLYTVIRCRYTGKPSVLQPTDEHLGKIDLSLPLSAEYARFQAQRLKKAAVGLSSSNPEKSEELTKIINLITEKIEGNI